MMSLSVDEDEACGAMTMAWKQGMQLLGRSSSGEVECVRPARLGCFTDVCGATWLKVL